MAELVGEDVDLRYRVEGRRLGRGGGVAGFMGAASARLRRESAFFATRAAVADSATAALMAG